MEHLFIHTTAEQAHRPVAVANELHLEKHNATHRAPLVKLMSPCIPRPIRVFSRLIVAWAAWVCLAAQGLNFAHAALSLHVSCLEHGEWMHAHDGAEHRHQPGSRTAIDTEARRVSLAVQAEYPAEDHQHEHCVVCCASPLAIDEPGFVWLVRTTGPAQAALIPTFYRRFFVNQRLLDDAPKTSPPLRA